MSKILHSLRGSVLFLGAIGVLVALVMALAGRWVQDRTAEASTAVFVAKDVVADILPPPMYLIEMRLVLSLAVEGTLDVDQAAKTVDRLAAEYKARAEHWSRSPPYGLERQLLGRQHEAGQRFITAGQQQVIGPLANGNRQAARNGLEKAHAVYLEQRAGVDETVTAGNQFATSMTASFDVAQTRSTQIALGVLAGAAVLLVLGCGVVLRSIEAPVQACA